MKTHEYKFFIRINAFNIHEAHDKFQEMVLDKSALSKVRITQTDLGRVK